MTVILLACGGLVLWLMRHSHSKSDPFLRRSAAVLFLAAGAAELNGWAGSLIRGFFQTALHTTNAGTQLTLGGAFAWIIGLAFAVVWIAGLLPYRLNSWEITVPFIVAGFFLPMLVAIVPGPAGDAFRSLFQWIAHAVTTIVGRWF